MPHELFLLTGMTPDRRIYQKITPLMDRDTAIVDWIPPGHAESIRDYSRRLVNEAGITKGCDIAGVSFGGMIAREIASQVGARLCFVISSVASSSELRFHQRWQGKVLSGDANMTLLRGVGHVARRWPGMAFISGAARSRKYSGSDGPWFRWATAGALNWQPPTDQGSTRFIRIHGDRDQTFPSGHLHADHVVSGAGHMLALTHSRELADIIRREPAAEDERETAL